jgi:hypothetical protein
MLFLRDPIIPMCTGFTSGWKTRKYSPVAYDNCLLPTVQGSFCNTSSHCLDASYSVAALWDDLFIGANTTQGLWYEVVQLTIPENQRSVIFEWYTTHRSDRSLRYHFTVQFFEHHPDWMTITYHEVGLDGAGATVGVQGGPGRFCL